MVTVMALRVAYVAHWRLSPRNASAKRFGFSTHGMLFSRHSFTMFTECSHIRKD